MKEHYSKEIMIALHEMLDIDLNATIEEVKSQLTTDEVLEAILGYEGIHGYTDKIIIWISEIFGVTLKEG